MLIYLWIYLFTFSFRLSLIYTLLVEFRISCENNYWVHYFLAPPAFTTTAYCVHLSASFPGRELNLINWKKKCVLFHSGPLTDVRFTNQHFFHVLQLKLWTICDFKWNLYGINCQWENCGIIGLAGGNNARWGASEREGDVAADADRTCDACPWLIRLCNQTLAEPIKQRVLIDRLGLRQIRGVGVVLY